MFLWFMNCGVYVLCCTATPKAEFVIQQVSKYKVQNYVFMVYESALPFLNVLCCTATQKAEGVLQQVRKQVLEFICFGGL